MLGFVGSPWTLATYIIEGSSSGLYKTIKTMIHGNPDLLSALLSHLADQIATYSCYQIQSGAQCIQLFDSWGGQLPPQVSTTLRDPINQSASCYPGLLELCFYGSMLRVHDRHPQQNCQESQAFMTEHA